MSQIGRIPRISVLCSAQLLVSPQRVSYPASSPQYHEPKDIDAAEHEEKHRRYETLYARRLRAKYFSKKAVDEGDIYDHETMINNEVIKSSRWPCTRSFADPIKYLEERNQSSYETETIGTPKQKQTSKSS